MSVNIQLSVLAVEGAFEETNGFLSASKGLATSLGKFFK